MTDPEEDLKLARALYIAATARLQTAYQACVAGQNARSLEDAARISVTLFDAASAAITLAQAIATVACEEED